MILLPPLRRFASLWAAFGCLSRFTRLFCLSLGLHHFGVGPLKVGLLGHGFANLGQRDLLDGQRVFLGVRNFGLEGGTSRRGGRCSNPPLPGVPASASAYSLPSGFERREAFGLGESWSHGRSRNWRRFSAIVCRASWHAAHARISRTTSP